MKQIKHHKEIAEFTLMDDTFFNVCFQNSPECVEVVIEAILGKKLTVKEHSVQKAIRKLGGGSVILDVKAVDSENRHYDIEIQRTDSGAGALRARYNAALMDASFKEPGEYGGNLPETYVIFITENDYWKLGLPKYTFERKCIESKNSELLLEDKLHIIYVNGSYVGDDPVGSLMNDFRSKNTADVKNKVLRNRMEQYKDNNKEEFEMDRVMDKLCREVREEQAKKTAKKMLEDGMNEELISKYSGLTLEEIEKLKKSA